MSILTVDNLSVRYGSKLAVEAVSFTAERREIISFVGESGSGKSTLLRALMHLLPPGGKISAGSIKLADVDITHLPERELRKLRGRHMAMVFQDCGRALNPILRIRTQYDEAIRAVQKGSSRHFYEMETSMLRSVHLSDPDRALASYPFELSGGMKQRVGISFAMTASPSLLLADEPTSALDVTIQAQVAYQLLELCKKYETTILLVTHNMGLASYISDKIGVMKNGKLVEWGSRDQIIISPSHPYTRHLLKAVPSLKRG